MDEVIDLARAMRAKYLESCTGVERLPINTLKLARVIGEENGVKVEAHVVPNLTHLRGILLLQPKKSALVLMSDQDNECWRRFTFIKEISHLFLGQPRSIKADYQAKVLVDMKFKEQYPDLYYYEISGIIAAIELLIPWGMKGYVAHLVNVYNLSSYQVASRFKVPQKFMEYRMRQWGIPVRTRIK